MRTRVHAIMDTIWPLGFVMIAAVSFGLSAGQGDLARRVLVLVLTADLGPAAGRVHLRAQLRPGRGQAVRLAAAAQPGQPGDLRAALHLLGAGPGHVVRVAAGAGGDVRARGLSARSPGWAWRCGRSGSASRRSATAQLRRFRSDPANAGRVLDRGLWRYTRHPNYFGDAVVWFGLWLLACSHWLGLLTVVPRPST